MVALAFVPIGVIADEPVYTFSEIVAAESNIGIEATARIREIVENRCSYTDRWLVGLEDGCPTSVMDNLKVIYKGKQVRVPASAYNALTNITGMYVYPAYGDLYSVIINTDMYSSSYETVIEFDAETLISRVVSEERRRRSSIEYVFDAKNDRYNIRYIRLPHDKYREYEEIMAEDGNVKVSVLVHKYYASGRHHINNGTSFVEPLGTSSISRWYKVERIAVTFAGEDVPVPASAYSDLIFRTDDMDVEVRKLEYSDFDAEYSYIDISGLFASNHYMVLFNNIVALYFDKLSIRTAITNDYFSGSVYKRTEYAHD